MFSGSQAITIDEKGRLAMPARFRAEVTEIARGQLAIARTPDGVKLYPLPVFEHIARTVIPAHADVAQRRLLLLRFVGESVQLEMDGQGRMLIPADYRGELTADAVLVGQVDHFLLVSATRWAEYKAASEPDYQSAFAALDL